MCYQPSVFDPKNVPNLSTHELHFYMKTVQFKLSFDSLGEIYQQNHWKELNLRRQPSSLLTLAQSGKCIVSSLLKSQKVIYPYFPINKLATICLSIPISTAPAERSFSDMKLIKNRHRNRLLNLACPSK